MIIANGNNSWLGDGMCPKKSRLKDDKCQFTEVESLWGSPRKIEAIPLILGPFMWITRIQLSEYLIPLALTSW